MRPSFEKIERYEDKSIFKYGQRFLQYAEQLDSFLQQQNKQQSSYAFPEKEARLICVLNKEEAPQKYFYIYDIFKN
jgi:hypothetical protein